MEWKKRKRLSLSPDRLKLVCPTAICPSKKNHREKIERFLRKELGEFERRMIGDFYRYQFKAGVFVQIFTRKVEIDFQGKYWNENPRRSFSHSKKIIKSLNKMLGYVFHVTRIDIQQLFHCKVEELLPLPRNNKDVWWSFVNSTPSYRDNQEGILETFDFRSSRFQICIYRKDIELKNYSGITPLTRLEIRILKSDACKMATHFFYSERGYLIFSKKVLSSASSKKAIRVKNKYENRKKWDRFKIWDELMFKDINISSNVPKKVKFSPKTIDFLRTFARSIFYAKEQG